MNKKYRILYADVPWTYKDKKCNGAVEKHYSLMKLQDICNLPIRKIADKDCILFFWATYPLMAEALRVIDAWGFTYKTIAFQWLKLNKKNGKPFFGLGRWTRGNTEPCLLATIGKPQRISKSVFQLIEQPIGRHSEKPAETRDKIIELMGDLPRIELFARQKAEGWDATGLELDGTDIRDFLKNY